MTTTFFRKTFVHLHMWTTCPPSSTRTLRSRHQQRLLRDPRERLERLSTESLLINLPTAFHIPVRLAEAVEEVRLVGRLGIGR
jgi:hypothetical protein